MFTVLENAWNWVESNVWRSYLKQGRTATESAPSISNTSATLARHCKNLLAPSASLPLRTCSSESAFRETPSKLGSLYLQITESKRNSVSTVFWIMSRITARCMFSVSDRHAFQYASLICSLGSIGMLQLWFKGRMLMPRCPARSHTHGLLPGSESWYTCISTQRTFAQWAFPTTKGFG